MTKRSWVRTVLVVVLLVVAAAAAGLWIARDQPRRRVERQLADGFGARVTLERLEAVGFDRFVLHGVELSEMVALPQLVRLRAERVHVRASLRAILAGRYREVRLSGVGAVVTHASRPARRGPGAGSLTVEHLPIEQGRLTVVDRTHEAHYEIAGALHGVGSALTGRLSVRSEGFGVSPLIALLFGPGELAHATRVESFEGTVSIEESGRLLRLEADSRAVTIEPARAAPELVDEIDLGPLTLPGIRLRGTAVFSPDGTVALEAQPSLPGIERAELFATLDSSGKILGGRAHLGGASVETLSAMLYPLPDGAEVRGTFDLDLVAADATLVEIKAHSRLERLRPPGIEPLALDGLSLSVDGTLSLDDATGAPTSCSYVLSARADHLALDGRELDLDVDGATLDLDGRTEFPSLASTFETELGLPSPRGRAAGVDLPRNTPSLELDGSGRARDGSVFGTVELVAAGVGRFDLDGSIALGSDPTGAIDWTWDGVGLEGLAAFAREAGVEVPHSFSARGTARAVGSLNGPLSSPGVTGRLFVEAFEVDGTPAGPEEAWRLAAGALEVAFALDRPGAPLRLATIALRGALELPPLHPVPLTLSATGQIETGTLGARLSKLELTAGDLAQLRGEAEWDGEARLGLLAEGVELERWQEFLHPWLGDPLPGFGFKGNLRSELRALWRAERGWTGDGRLGLSASSMAHQDGSRVVEGAESDWQLSFAAPDRETLRLDAAGRIDGFLLLWGRIFGDYSERGAEVKLQLDTAPADRTADWRIATNLLLDDGASLDGSISAAPARPLAYTAHVVVPDLERTFREWVHDPLAGSLPALERMVSAGSLAATLSGSVAAAQRVLAGRVQVRDGSLEGTGGSVFIRGLQLDLPVDLDWQIQDDGTLRLADGEARSGRLEFDRLAFGDVGFGRTATDLRVRSDTVGLEEGLALPLLGGVLGFEELTLVDGIGGDWRLETGLLLSQIRLDVLSEALGILPLEGVAEGYFPRVRLNRARLFVDGDGELDVFGGRLTVREISGEDVLSRFPKLTFSAELEAIDLLEVTHTFDFGEMSGLIDGNVSNCELFRWVPVRCGARFGTVPEKTVPRTINVKAVNNLAILGTGGGQVSALDRGIHKFLDRYTYDRLGVAMELDNDRFVLRGLERRGRRELFLKGRLPFRIDVVNVQPGRAIAFRGMLDRIKRMEFADFDIR